MPPPFCFFIFYLYIYINFIYELSVSCHQVCRSCAMAECSFARCQQERRAIRKELQRWTKNMVYILGKLLTNLFFVNKVKPSNDIWYPWGSTQSYEGYVINKTLGTFFCAYWEDPGSQATVTSASYALRILRLWLLSHRLAIPAEFGTAQYNHYTLLSSWGRCL